MTLRSYGWVVAVFMLSACSAALDTSLEHKRCTSTGRCLAGYTCSDTGFCERSNDAQIGPAVPMFDADLDPGASQLHSDASFGALPPSAANPSVAQASQMEADAAPTPTQPTPTQDTPAQPPPTQTQPTQTPATQTQPTQTPATQTQPAQTPATQNTPTQPPPAQMSPPPGAKPSPQGPAAMGACGTGQMRCGSTCVDLQRDASNCGTCDHACTSTEGGSARCEQGSCEVNCTGGLTACGGQCLDVANDSAHCGNCNKACKKEENCSAGKCAKSKAEAGPG
jgi:hypothetical protein